MNSVNTEREIITALNSMLESGRTASFVPRDDSMSPMLKSGLNAVLLKKPQGRLHLFDIALFYNADTDSCYLRRVSGFRKDGTYVMLADNNAEPALFMRDEDITGVVSAFYRKGRMYSVTHPIYRLYCNFRYYTRPFRRINRRHK